MSDPIQDSLTPQQESWFAQWWKIYWRRVARKPARGAFAAIVSTEARFLEIIAATRAQMAEMETRDPSKRPHGATWLRAERWTDEIAAEVATPRREAQSLIPPFMRRA